LATVVVPNRLLVVPQVVLLLRLGILLHQGILLHRGILPHWGILLWGILFLVGRLVEVGWAVVPAISLVLCLVGWVYLVLAPFVGLFRLLLCGVPFVG